MSYHPIMGITIFLIFIILAFILGRKTNIKPNYKIDLKDKYNNKNIVFTLNKQKKIKSEAISPDASWLDK